MSNENVEPKKRGRKPKPKNIEIDNAPVKLKRGRKPKIKQAEDVNEIIKNSNVNDNDESTIILKLHYDSINENKDNDIHRDENRERDFLNYRDDLESPKGYNNDNAFLSNPETISFNKDNLPKTLKLKNKLHSDSTDNNTHINNVLNDFIERDNWPITTDTACFWCCHPFNNTPFGIPFKYINNKFIVYGCFCSLECATAYNFSIHNKDINDIWENYSLINLLANKLNYKNYIKSAPPRETLKLFGGYMTIDKFRTFCNTNKLINILNYPMILSQYQVEEFNEQSINNSSRLYIPIDTERLKKIEQKFKLIRQKPILNSKNTLEHTMNLKIESKD